jgi:hypothetical protein
MRGGGGTAGTAQGRCVLAYGVVPGDGASKTAVRRPPGAEEGEP